MKKILNGILVDMTADEIAARQAEETAWNAKAFDRAIARLRTNRNNLLAETDYIVTKNLEAGTDIPTDWKTYRQSLRDLTNGLTTVEEVNAVVFPTKPE
jgi:hypothetical protein